MFKPRHTVESVTRQLIEGLQDGSVVLDSEHPQAPAQTKVTIVQRLKGVLRGETSHTIESAAKQIADGLEDGSVVLGTEDQK